MKDLRKRVTELEAEVLDLRDQVDHFRKSLRRMHGRRSHDPPDTVQEASEIDIAMREIVRGQSVE